MFSEMSPCFVKCCLLSSRATIFLALPHSMSPSHATLVFFHAFFPKCVERLHAPLGAENLYFFSFPKPQAHTFIQKTLWIMANSIVT